MNKGFTGTILSINLSSKKNEKIEHSEEFYRKYMGGSAIGAYFLLKRTKPDTRPLESENVITIAGGITTGAAVSGVSRCCITSLSPETNAVGDTQVGGSIGPMIKKAGYDAVVISGKASSPSYILINGEDISIERADDIWGKTILEAHDILSEKYGSKNLSILQCGPAGENLVGFACLMGDLNDAAGRTGMGAVFGSKNLRAVVVKGNGKIQFHNNAGLKAMAKKGIDRIPGSGFPETLKKYGTPGVVGAQAEAGNMATHNFSKSFHEKYKNLDGSVFEPEIGAGGTTCFGCAVGCRKKVTAQKPYRVTDRLGGPEFETLGLLGTNLDITDAVAVAKANELCNNYGLDTIGMGGIASYLFECMEKKVVTSDQTDGRILKFGDADDLLWLIDKIIHREGIGDILADGLVNCVKKLGKKTAPYAIHIKNHVPAVHMAQVKPSLALMYAVCPIGADHMSSLHDWHLSSDSEISKGLGIFGSDDPDGTGLNKVRMTVYSQYFYSFLDSICLCMFCWGCGSLYSYSDVEDLINSATGWDCTFWELMKVGERRMNMLRIINARRGFSKNEDKLPERLFKPLKGGPADGKCVNKENFPVMIEQYYGLMGWNENGNPGKGKILELGLEWTV